MEDATNTIEKQYKVEKDTTVAELKEDHKKQISELKERLIKANQAQVEEISRSEIEKYNQLNMVRPKGRKY